MSWLSDRLGTTGKTPAIIKRIGNVAGGAVVHAIPLGGGGLVDKLFNLTGSQPSSSSSGLAEIVDRTGDNLNTQLDRASALNQATTFLSSPVGIILLVAIVVLLFRKKG